MDQRMHEKLDPAVITSMESRDEGGGGGGEGGGKNNGFGLPLVLLRTHGTRMVQIKRATRIV